MIKYRYMPIKIVFFLFLMSAGSLIGQVTDPVISLSQVYKDYFKIGVAVSPRALKTDEAQLILSQFNSMTPENAMKMGPIHPQEELYNWAGGDSIAAFAQRNNLFYAGTLCVGTTRPLAGYLKRAQAIP